MIHKCYAQCALTLIDGANKTGVDVVVYCADPGWSPYDQGFFECPHRRRYWLRPSPWQIQKWEREGTP